MAAENLKKAEEKLDEAQSTEGGHALAIGFYIAAVILLFGTILVLYGILGPASQAQKSLGVNLNLWWGLFMVVFGCIALGLSYASPRRRAARQTRGE